MNVLSTLPLYPFIWQSLLSFFFTLGIVRLLAKTLSLKDANVRAYVFMIPIAMPLLLPFRGEIGLMRWAHLLMSAPDIARSASEFHQVLPLICLIPPSAFILHGFLSYCAYRHILRNVRQITEEQEPQLFSLLNTLARKTGISLPLVYLLPQNSVQVFTCGTLRPVLAVSPMLLSELPAKELEAVLAHEVAHLARCDQITSWIVSLISTLMFYNPFLYPLLKRIGHEREKAADALAVRLTHNPRALAQSLLRVMKLAGKNNSTPAFFNLPVLKLTGGDALCERVKILLAETSIIDESGGSTGPLVFLFLSITAISNILVLLPLFQNSACVMMLY